MLTSQIARAIRIGSDDAARNRGLDKTKNIFTQNGYPEKMIDKHIGIEKRKFAASNNGRKERQERGERKNEKREKTTYIHHTTVY